jgi:hypothetical protein
MSSDNKRRTSSPASGEVIKRARKDSTEGLNGDSLSVASPPNQFFELPREIRDEIYAYAFGHGRLYLTHGALEISATHPDEATFREPGKCGLPPWMLSSKQMCSEALAVLGGTREFSPNSPYSCHCKDFKKQALNPPVFNANVIRNISLQAGSKSIPSFFKILRSFNPDNLSLEAMRFASCYMEVPNSTPVPLLGFNESFWHGRFRKVEITVEVFSMLGKALEKIRLQKTMEDAPAEGLRLVGMGAEVVIGETKPRRWVEGLEQTVVVQRKV